MLNIESFRKITKPIRYDPQTGWPIPIASLKRRRKTNPAYRNAPITFWTNFPAH